MKTWILACVAALIAVTPAIAEKRLIIRGSSANVSGCMARNRLALVHQSQANGHALVLASSPSGLTPDAAHDGVSVESDRPLRVPELQDAPGLKQSTVAILGALGKPTLTGYFGQPVWAGYLAQPAGRIMRLPESRALAIGRGVVAVIDTGVDPTHPALAGALMQGFDFTRNQPGAASELADLQQSTVAILDAASPSIEDKVPVQVNQSTVAILDQSTVAILDRASVPASFGHGTMVASLVRLVAPGATILPLKAFSGDGTGSLYNVLRAIYFAVDSGARVINMSFSIDEPSPELDAAISYANSRRVICVASAGNAGLRTMVYPAAYKKVAGVGSTSNDDTRSSFSNYGNDLVTFAAPGEGLIAAWPGRNWAAASGTSFSTALASGAAALIVEIDPNANQSQAEAALAQADPAGPGLGAGRLDLVNACSWARRH